MLQDLFKTPHHPKDCAGQQRGGGPWRTNGKPSMTSSSNASVGAVARVGIKVSCTNADAGGGTEDAQ